MNFEEKSLLTQCYQNLKKIKQKTHPPFSFQRKRSQYQHLPLVFYQLSSLILSVEKKNWKKIFNKPCLEFNPAGFCLMLPLQKYEVTLPRARIQMQVQFGSSPSELTYNENAHEGRPQILLYITYFILPLPACLPFVFNGEIKINPSRVSGGLNTR